MLRNRNGDYCQLPREKCWRRGLYDNGDKRCDGGLSKRPCGHSAEQKRLEADSKALAVIEADIRDSVVASAALAR
jgi:hypothetical protein